MSLYYEHFGPSSAHLLGAPGASNALGLDAHQTWAFWRAQVNAFVESPFRCRNGELATMAIDRTLPPRAHGPARVAASVRRALSQLEPALARLRGVAACFAIALPDERWTGRCRAVGRAAVDAALTRLTELGFGGQLEAHAEGHGSLAQALAAACNALKGGAAEIAIVGGADSYYDPQLVEQLLLEGRLFDLVDLHTMIPGEGAAFFLLGPAHMLRRAGIDADARLEALAVAREPAPMLPDVGAPSVARGLTQVLKSLTSYLQQRQRRLDWIVGDLTHETYRSNELELALPRALAPGGMDDGGASFAPIASDALAVDFVPERFGDMGAASMATAAVIAMESFRRKTSDAATCLVYGSTPTGLRGGVLLSPYVGGMGQ